jgi:hypothetical protein
LLLVASLEHVGALERFGEIRLLPVSEAKQQLIAELNFPPKLMSIVRTLRVKASRIDRFSVLVLAAGLLVVAASAWPYDAYLVCKCIVFLVCGKVAFGVLNRHKSSLWPKVLGIIAILYNPFLSIHFHRPTWVVINLLTAGTLAVFGLLIKPDHAPASQPA